MSKVPVGYKQTETGVIPEDWEPSPLPDIIWFQEGPGLRKWQFRSDGLKIINVTNLQETGCLDLSKTDRHISWEEFERVYKHFLIDDGDVVMASSGNSYCKTSVVRRCDLPLLMNTSVIRFKAKDKIGRSFMLIYLKSKYFKDQIDLMITGGAQPNFGPAHLAKVLIPLPPTKAEQEAIAETLSDTDALIESLEQLIAKKRHLKQGGMQELLTGKKRLPGFSGELEVKRLGELGEFLKGSGVRKDESFSGDLPCIRYGEIYTKHCNCIKTFHSWISPEVAATAKRLKRGDILFAGSGETKEEIGKCVAFVDDFEAYAGGDIVILRPENSCSTFLGYYLNTTPINQQKASKGQGDAVVHIGSAALSSIEIQIPPLPEQTAIAAILSDMDAEIAALETKLAKTRQLKQGMMHNLLTGKIRLVSATANIIVIPEQRDSVRTSTSSHNWQINEAVIIAVLAKHFGSEQYPLARKRCTKLTYLLHRHVERKAEGYLKKAAGPYNPATRYKGPEGIAQKNGYVRAHHNGTYQGFVAAANIGQAEDYFQEWYGQETLAWLEQFRLKKTDELELLTTVDMAMEDLHREGKAIQVGTVKQVIHDHPEWIAKLRRELFSDINIARAMQTCRNLFA